jgi:hypothetical protein
LQKIEIREKLAPFSHMPGVRCLVPLSDYTVQVYPAALLVQGQKIPLPFHFPDFTVQMDLERDCLWLWDKKHRLKLHATETGLYLGDERIATDGKTFPKQPCERLSLGNWKAQDWDLVRRRHNLLEIAPALFLLGQKTPVQGTKITHPEHFFLAASQNLCVPTQEEAALLGLPPLNMEPLALFHASYQTFRSYLLDGASILPHLPPEWHAGRALGLQTPFGTLDLEWSKKTIRRMIVHATESQEVAFKFKRVKSCRCNGKASDGAVQLEAGKDYLLDRFRA